MLKNVFADLYADASALNKRNILELMRDRQYPTLCDLGCDDGEWTKEVVLSARSNRVSGIEIVTERARIARSNGVQVVIADLAATFPFEDQSFDLVHANQVIEHVSNLDNFLSEICRVLRPGGAAIVSTENASSWHNIFASVMGWQIFSLTNVSSRVQGIGNPLALHRGSSLELSTWTHKTIFNYQGLLEMLEVHGLKAVRVLGAGYHPLPASIGRVDVRHAHFLTVRAVKAGVPTDAESEVSTAD